MITVIFGLPGAGKSYNAVAQYVLPSLKDNRAVYVCGLKVNDSRVIDVPSAEGLRLENIEGGSLVVIDEAWRFFPSGQKQSNVPEGLRAFLALHRHRTSPAGIPLDILLICQSIEQLAGWARQLIDQVVWVSVSRASGLTLRRLRRWEGGKVEGSPIEDSSFAIEPAIAGMYQSADDRIVSDTGSKTGSIWRNKWLISGAILALVLFVGASISGYKLLAKYRHKSPVPSAQAVIPSRKNTAGSFLNGAALHEQNSTTQNAPFKKDSELSTSTPAHSWRIAARLDFGGSPKSVVGLINGEGYMVQIPMALCHVLRDTRGEWVCPFAGKWYWGAGEWTGEVPQ